ncbi:hypothetical protein DSO57_1004310 [Entomophthora muscae]|uniref:Uncharacterized protein n=1 Tax=Entomophthora muscae TaxID=34485 RepID=A0ACC2TV98_9FUNG|nr:hypothetical protein DSO57_1004310 [Entomophthora muscae]
MKHAANQEIEALKAREEKSVDIMARWRDDNKVLSQKIASLEFDWFALNPSHVHQCTLGPTQENTILHCKVSSRPVVGPPSRPMGRPPTISQEPTTGWIPDTMWIGTISKLLALPPEL